MRKDPCAYVCWTLKDVKMWDLKNKCAKLTEADIQTSPVDHQQRVNSDFSDIHPTLKTWYSICQCHRIVDNNSNADFSQEGRNAEWLGPLGPAHDPGSVARALQSIFVSGPIRLIGLSEEHSVDGFPGFKILTLWRDSSHILYFRVEVAIYLETVSCTWSEGVSSV